MKGKRSEQTIPWSRRELAWGQLGAAGVSEGVLHVHKQVLHKDKYKDKYFISTSSATAVALLGLSDNLGKVGFYICKARLS